MTVRRLYSEQPQSGRPVNTKYIQRVPDGMGTWLAIFDNDGDVAANFEKRGVVSYRFR